MTKTVLLHVGTAKTGTTSIQRYLAQLQASGQLGPLCYPLWGDDYNQQRLVVIYRPYEELPPASRQSYPASKIKFNRMRERYSAFVFGALRSADAAVISAENLCQYSPRHLDQLRIDLESLGFEDFHIALYVRDPADFYLSDAQQCLRSASVPPHIEDPASFRYEFLRAAEMWEQAFPGRLMVRRLPDNSQHDVVEDFVGLIKRCFGVALPEVALRMNPTISAEAMNILDDYRRTFWPRNGGLLTTDTARLVRFLRESAQDISQTKPVLKKEVAAVIRGNHQADAEVLHSRFGVDLGLRNCDPQATVPRREPFRVAEIVEEVNPDVVRRLLLRLAHTELSRDPVKRTLPIRLAARAYRMIPPDRRPRLDVVERISAGQKCARRDSNP